MHDWPVTQLKPGRNHPGLPGRAPAATLITGSGKGLGYETARQLTTGHAVCIGVRDGDAGSAEAVEPLQVRSEPTSPSSQPGLKLLPPACSRATPGPFGMMLFDDPHLILTMCPHPPADDAEPDETERAGVMRAAATGAGQDCWSPWFLAESR